MSSFYSLPPLDASNAPVDIPLRLTYLNSPIMSLLHYRKKSALDCEVEFKSRQFFQNRYGYENPQAFERIWKTLTKDIWSPSSPLTFEVIDAIDRKFKESIVYHGEGVKAAPWHRYPTDQVVQKFVKSLLHGRSLSNELLQSRTIKAIFVHQDKELMIQFVNELQNELDHLAENPPQTQEQTLIWKAFLGNILALIPFAYPEHLSVMRIPRLTEQGCKISAYRLEILPLQFQNPASSPMHAVGMTPIDDHTAPPIFSFMGTTFPAVDGFATTVMADFTPGFPVGGGIYEHNREAIDAWFSDKKNVHLVGMSLGGALVFHALLHHHQKVTRADLYNPPGLYQHSWKSEMGTCEINIFNQPGDLVSEMGVWPTQKTINLYEVIPHQDNLAENVLSSHARAFTGCEKITILKHKPEEQNRSLKRRFLTMLHRCFGPLVFYFPLKIALFFRYVARRVSSVALRIFIPKTHQK